jgi:predicted AAA+ superfamily ATPase
MGFDLPPLLIGKLWKMLSHMHGQILKVNDLAVSLNLDPRTVRKYISILEGTFMIRSIRPFHTNLGKREVKTAKVFIRDSGLLHQLLSLKENDIENHPRMGASFEGFVLEQIIYFIGDDHDCYFWSTHQGAEIDLLCMKGDKKTGYEIKFSDSPKITKSMHTALHDLKLDHLYVIVPIGESFKMSEKITCVPLKDLEMLLDPMSR